MSTLHFVAKIINQDNFENIKPKILEILEEKTFFEILDEGQDFLTVSFENPRNAEDESILSILDTLGDVQAFGYSTGGDPGLYVWDFGKLFLDHDYRPSNTTKQTDFYYWNEDEIFSECF
jgi:hypothetical protein